MANVARAHAAAAAVVLVFAGIFVLGDVDFDGLRGYSELALGTRLWSGDTDGDMLGDGWEFNAGFDPKRADADGDGRIDWQEILARTSPFNADSDGDGIRDGNEPRQDCDGDGLPAAAESDDDNDGRVDALEPALYRCNADVDGDGVLDGYEGATLCVVRHDCDGDGLNDALEGPALFNPLAADTYGVGLPDAVSWAFAQQGQPPGRDEDMDGIPDPWEGANGAISWGGLTPSAGRKDLLIEFLRASGPQSGRFDLDFSPAYRAVADAFLAQSGIHMTWTETRVNLAQETVPPIVPSVSEPYYQATLAQAKYSTNPFVTTVILNPQHDQSSVAHSGIAPIRGMIAAVDYGQAALFEFQNGTTSTLQLTPLIESLVRGNQQGLLIEAGYDQLGISPTGRITLHAVGGSTGGYTISWQPMWFNSILVVDVDGPQKPLNMTISKVTVGQATLAHTILHELGHTLGLCHSHDATCDTLDERDRARQYLSTMSYNSSSATLQFLPSEWTTVREYLACPPVEPVTLRSQGARDDAILAAKYTVPTDAETSTDDRTCNDFLEIPKEYESGVPEAQFYAAPAWYDNAEGGQSYAWLSIGLTLAMLGLAVGLDLLLLRRFRVVAEP